jgi:hypothetical protein
MATAAGCSGDADYSLADVRDYFVQCVASRHHGKIEALGHILLFASEKTNLDGASHGAFYARILPWQMTPIFQTCRALLSSSIDSASGLTGLVRAVFACILGKELTNWIVGATTYFENR